MAIQKRGRTKKVFRNFYINGDLHRVLRVSRGEDLLVAWNFNSGKRVAYSWTDVQKNMQHAYSLSQVSSMVNRHKMIIQKYIWDGSIKPVQRAYTLDERKAPGSYYFSEDDIRDLHSFLLTVHIGRPRKDGKITASNLPTRAELEAMLRQEVILYVKDKDGDFAPVWKQPEW